MVSPTEKSSYASVRREIHDGDLLLFHPTTWLGRFIAWGTRGDYSHAAMAIWWHGRLFAVGTEQWRGNQPEPLSELVARYPGMIDVLRPCRFGTEAHGGWITESLSAAERTCVASAMISMISQRYGWRSFLRAGLIRSLLLGWVWRRVLRSDDDRAGLDGGHLPHCAQAYCLALDRGARLDPRPRLAPFATTPADLGRSKYFAKLFTLVP